MADKAIAELVEAERITATDLFVLQQDGTAKKLPGQVLLNWLTAAADGHGGIQNIAKVSTSGLIDTYRITLADTTNFDFAVTNGRGITKIAKTKTSGLVDTYTITYNDGTTGTFTVTNGAKGEKGDNAYIWIKYASQLPTSSAVSLGDVPDAWMGVYVGTASAAPTAYSSYSWYQIKGEKGDTGDAAKLLSAAVEFQISDSGEIVPSGSWSSDVPTVPQGKYLWTRTTLSFNSGSPVVLYSVGRMGRDGTGAILSVAGVYADDDGNVPLTASHVGAAPTGYGLGKTAPPTLDDANKVVPAQFFRITSNTDNLSATTHWSGIFLPYGSSEGTEFMVRNTTGLIRVRRTADGSTWFDEYVNPSMNPGVEYTTTERSAGKTVYAKRVSYEFSDALGSSDSSVEYNVPHGIIDFGRMVRWTANDGTYNYPYFGSSGGIITVKAVDANNIIVRCVNAYQVVPRTLEFDLYYTKE